MLLDNIFWGIKYPVYNPCFVKRNNSSHPLQCKRSDEYIGKFVEIDKEDGNFVYKFENGELCMNSDEFSTKFPSFAHWMWYITNVNGKYIYNMKNGPKTLRSWLGIIYELGDVFWGHWWQSSVQTKSFRQLRLRAKSVCWITPWWALLCILYLSVDK